MALEDTAPGVRLRANRLLTAAGRSLIGSEPMERTATSLFHRLYYGQPDRTWQNTRWLGTKIMKCPLDLWIYQELVFSVKPDLIIETGTFTGGSAHFLASICDLADHGRVVTVDIERRGEPPEHPRITHLLGSSTSDEIVTRMRQEAEGAVMVILDSDHSRDHVLAELDAYAPLVTPGSYVIVEDTNVNGHPASPNHGPGPMEAVDEFLASNPAFAVDPECEKFFMTFNPRGYLRRS